MRLADGTATTTDENGYYKFPAVAAGTTTVILEGKRIPAAFTFLGDETSTLNIQRRAQARVDFPYVRGGSIKGQVLSVSTKKSGDQGIARCPGNCPAGQSQHLH